MRLLSATVIAVTCLGTGCGPGSIGDALGEADAPTETPPDVVLPAGAPGLEVLEQPGLRRLTMHEYHATLEALIGDASEPGRDLWPEDPRTPFDNDAAHQDPTSALVMAAESAAIAAADALTADAARRDALVRCSPTAVDDEACMRSFVTSFGRRALRRPLRGDEVTDFVTLGRTTAIFENDFFGGVNVVVRALLQDIELLYRVEIGEPVDGYPGLFRLNGYEIATRLSYFLLGTTPDDTLLDLASMGELDTAEGRRVIGEGLLADPRAVAQLDRFHALWLGYEQLPHAPELTRAMREESAALVERIVLDEKRSWLDLFLADETYVDDTLAAHYGLPAPAGGRGWVTLEGTERRGLLSQGSFLGAGMVTGESDPVRRGLYVRQQILCEEVPPPPPDVLAEPQPPGDDQCKYDWYAAHRSGPCADCHRYFDPIGFGLERYDTEGRFRTTEPGRPECAITGQGELYPVGTFEGPAELGELLVGYEPLRGCLTRRVYQFAMGSVPGARAQAFVDWMKTELERSGDRLDQVLLSLVSHPAFGYRLEEE